jgi:hypothetical protein
VLYNYVPIESDEIPLTKGLNPTSFLVIKIFNWVFLDELLEVLSGPDNLGWCYGRKGNSKEGLFPASYVEPAI